MRRNLAVLGALGVLAVGCSSGTLAGHVDAGKSPGDAGAVPFFDGGPWPLDGGGSISSLTLSTNDLVVDSTRGVIYASQSGLGDAGNSVLTIDPASMKVTETLPVGGPPTVLALSDDGSALYVGINTPGPAEGDSVRRIDLATKTAGPAVPLGSNTITTYTPGQIAAVPGSSTRYVVSLTQPGVIPPFAGLALYDGGTLLALLDPFYGSGDSITFADASTLIGCSDGQDPSELIEYSVTTAAITPVPGGKVSGLLTGGQSTQITFNGGWIFANNGQTVSAKTLGLVGTYDDSIIAKYADAAAVPDPNGTDVWFLRTADYRKAALVDFDRTTFQLRRTISLAPVTVDPNLDSATALVQWSPTGFAFKTYSRVYVITVAN